MLGELVRAILKLHVAVLVVLVLAQALLACGIGHDHLPGEEGPGTTCVACHASALVAHVAPPAAVTVATPGALLHTPRTVAAPATRPRRSADARAPPAWS